MQSFFIGVGAIVASMLPWFLTHAGVSNHAEAGGVPDAVHYSFYIGAIVLFTAVGWTVLRSREYPPEALRSFADAQPETAAPAGAVTSSRRNGLVWSAIAIAAVVAIWIEGLDAQLYILCGLGLAWGIALLLESVMDPATGFASVMRDFHGMPQTMRRLAWVQFFSWLALFAMWIYTTAAVTQVHYGTTDAQSDAYNEGANWVGVLFGAYNGFAALAAVVIPIIAARLGLRLAHLINLFIGGIALISFRFIHDPSWLLLAMVGIGFAWASILSVPYALLANSVPTQKMGLYMGIFNFFIVIPQLVAASVLGTLVNRLFGGAPIYALVLGGASFMLAGLLVLRVR
jgi:maltose/moltooligosaccharide transporter